MRDSRVASETKRRVKQGLECDFSEARSKNSLRDLISLYE